MDQENKNVEATNEEKALQSFLDGTNDYEEEKAPEAPKLVMNKGEILISALSLFALAMWTLSNYGAAMICTIAIAIAVFTKSGKDAMHTVTANGLALGTFIVIKATLNVPSIIAEVLYNYGKLSALNYASFSRIIYVINAVLSVCVFVVFVINAFQLLSKKRLFIFGKAAAKISDKED